MITISMVLLLLILTLNVEFSIGLFLAWKMFHPAGKQNKYTTYIYIYIYKYLKQHDISNQFCHAEHVYCKNLLEIEDTSII